MSEILGKFGMGWLPDYPDFRDHTIDHDKVPERLLNLGQKVSIKKMLTKVGAEKPARAGISSPVNLQEWFSPVEEQGSLGSCTANAGVASRNHKERSLEPDQNQSYRRSSLYVRVYSL